MNKARKFLICLVLTHFNLFAFAQDAKMADVMRSEGKIYVVVAIILIILAGLIAYLFLLDRKLSRMEKRMEEKERMN